MEAYELPDREFKITVIKLLSKLKIMMPTPNENINQEKHKKEQNRNFGAEEYNNFIEDFTRGCI